MRRVRTLLSELGAPAPVMADLGAAAHDNGNDDGWRLWRLCAAAPLTALDSQRLLETGAPGDRLTLLTELCDALAGDLSQLLGRGSGD